VLSSVEKLPFALYITSPDYLGNICDIKALSEVCHKYGVLLLVDNAHGAYLAFTDKRNHPILLGADMCTDSAHKTLSTITGGAYLHISRDAPKFFIENARKALSLFGSTSPSYLILASLDKTNEYLENEYRVRLSNLISNVELLKSRLSLLGYSFLGDEKIKLTIDALEYGYYGTELGEHLIKQGIVPEFYDKERFAREFSMAADVAKRHGIPVYCGEYGCLSDESNDQLRYRWLTDMNDVFDELGIARAVWCYREGEDGFGILSGLQGPVDQQMLDALLK
jgi:arginine/lysine/ornithine decarboxylase